MAELIVKFKIQCDKCHSDLDFEILQDHKDDIVSVKPCSECTQTLVENERQAIKKKLANGVTKAIMDM